MKLNSVLATMIMLLVYVSCSRLFIPKFRDFIRTLLKETLYTSIFIYTAFGSVNICGIHFGSESSILMIAGIEIIDNWHKLVNAYKKVK